jgi:hypothetical protein
MDSFCKVLERNWKFVSVTWYKQLEVCSVLMSVCISIFSLVDLRFFCRSKYVHTLTCLCAHYSFLVNVYNKQTFHLNGVYLFFVFLQFLWLYNVTSKISFSLFLFFFHGILAKLSSHLHLLLGVLVQPCF